MDFWVQIILNRSNRFLSSNQIIFILRMGKVWIWSEYFWRNSNYTKIDNQTLENTWYVIQCRQRFWSFPRPHPIALPSSSRPPTILYHPLTILYHSLSSFVFFVIFTIPIPSHPPTIPIPFSYDPLPLFTIPHRF